MIGIAFGPYIDLSLIKSHQPMSTPKIKFFIDAEFIEDGKTIDLISLALVCETGETFYAISNEFDPANANDWVKENVIAKLESPMDRPELWMSRAQLRLKMCQFILDNIGDNKPEFWGYYADYDWVVLCQLFGTMMQLPEHFPKYCRDIKQLCDFLGNPELPKQADGDHNALADAKWHWEAYRWLEGKIVGTDVVIGQFKKERDEAIHERDACHKCWNDFTAKVGTAIDGFARMTLFQGADKIVDLIVTTLDERDDSRRTANLLGVRFSELQSCYKIATGKDCDYAPVVEVEKKAVTLQHQLNQAKARLEALEQTRPYDCYWSRRALAAEGRLAKLESIPEGYGADRMAPISGVRITPSDVRNNTVCGHAHPEIPVSCIHVAGHAGNHVAALADDGTGSAKTVEWPPQSPPNVLTQPAPVVEPPAVPLEQPNQPSAAPTSET
jgi:hypothetical protein